MNNSKVLLILMLTAVLLLLSSHAKAASIEGTVTYEGKVPKFREIKMEADPICLSKHTEKVFPETLVLGENNAMANVFVRIKEGIFDKKFTAPVEPVVITQEGCMYTPHVIALMVGQPLKILNPDGTLHNVHALSKINSEFNLAMPKFRRETEKTFDKAEFMFPIKCDVHPWMSAWISVMDHPFFDVTKNDGKFYIDSVPEGRFVIEAWHEKLGTQTGAVIVSGRGKFEIDFVFSR